jgi:hypothetical protein
MIEKPSTIRNLGPASDIFYGRAGITSAEKLREMGADEAYYQALVAGGSAHFIGYYAMVMGLQDRPWNDCKGLEKDALKDRFNVVKSRLKSTPTSASAFDKELAKLGVIKRD